MSVQGITKNYTANGAIAAFRIVKLSSKGIVQVAGAATDKSVGVTQDLAAADGDRTDVQHSGIAWVTAGAAIAVGDPLTSDASGRVITAAPAGGANVRVVGYALEDAAAAGDVINVQLSLGVMQG